MVTDWNKIQNILLLQNGEICITAFHAKTPSIKAYKISFECRCNVRFVRSMSDFRSHAQTEADADRGRHGYIREDLHHFRPHLTSCLC